VVTWSPRRFATGAAGKKHHMFKMRYALLGWLAWMYGKRVLRRKLHLA
jgi:hypothetical protein